MLQPFQIGGSFKFFNDFFHTKIVKSMWMDKVEIIYLPVMSGDESSSSVNVSGSEIVREMI